MRFRVQQLDDGNKRRAGYLLCTQHSASDAWDCRAVNDLQLDKALRSFGFEDHREASVIYQQARAAVREFGLGQGYIEYDLESQQDPVRHQGDLRETQGGAK